MTARYPLVLVNGRPAELPSSDILAGDALPLVGGFA
jgi:hypothetical protein